MSIRSALKSSVVGISRLIPRMRADERVVVLLYHSIDPDAAYSSATPEEFRRHLRWLKDNCRIVSLEEIPRSASNRRRGPTVAITFDDGHLDNYVHAFPILADEGVPATFFLTAGYLGKDPSVLSRMAGLHGGPVQPIEWEQAREMQRSGMSFGAHTYSHPNLALLDRAAARDEIERSRELVSEELGRPVGMFAYPFGRQRWHFTAETVDVVRQLGFELATSVAWQPVRPRDCPYTIPRYWVIHDGLRELGDKIGGVMDFAGLGRHLPLPLARRLYAPEFEH